MCDRPWCLVYMACSSVRPLFDVFAVHAGARREAVTVSLGIQPPLGLKPGGKSSIHVCSRESMTIAKSARSGADGIVSDPVFIGSAQIRVV